MLHSVLSYLTDIQSHHLPIFSHDSDDSTNYFFGTNHDSSDNSGASNGVPSSTGDATKSKKSWRRGFL